MSKLYVVTMHRWGSQRTHSYVLGAYRSMGSAHLHGDIERENRGGCKYNYRVTVCPSGPARGQESPFRDRRGAAGDAFQRRLAWKRAMNWYKAGDHARFGAL